MGLRSLKCIEIGTVGRLPLPLPKHPSKRNRMSREGRHSASIASSGQPAILGHST